MKIMKYSWIALIVLIPLILAGCTTTSEESLSASGFLAAVESSVAPELSGKVVSIEVEEGQAVTSGQTLIKLDDEFIRAQRDQAAAAVTTAEAAVQAAESQVSSAKAQYEMALQEARLQDAESRRNAWFMPVGEDDRPSWYYQKSELIAAAKAQVDKAQQALNDELADLENELEKATSKDFVAVEQRLAEAQYGYASAQQTYDQASLTGDDNLENSAGDRLETARLALEDARHDYDAMLSTSAAEGVMEARARVAVAQYNLDHSRDTLLMLQTGDESLQVKAAEAAVKAAEAAAAQARGGLDQAKEALKLAELQLERTEVKAPFDGVILARNLEVGELAAAGGPVMRIGKLESLDLVVYLPEDQYGKVNLGDKVMVSVDSFPDRQYTGEVIRISDEAEYTPRNVQTEKGRKATVYAVKIRVDNPSHELKPGMPADVDF